LNNGGIKSLFKIDKKYYAMVAAKFENDCPTVKIFDIETNRVLLSFPCLSSSKQIDFNGVGGAYLKLSDGTDILSVGIPTDDFEDRMLAQDDDSPWGKLISLNMNDNRFNYQILTKGHRNPQGLFEHDGRLFSVEHGPRGGDELNLITIGGNYGWPLVSFGDEYSLESINSNQYTYPEIKTGSFNFLPSIGISSVNNCPDSYVLYYSPNKCIAVGSLRGSSIDFIVFDKEYSKVLWVENINLKSRIRKFKFEGDMLYAITDFSGLIIGKLSRFGL